MMNPNVTNPCQEVKCDGCGNYRNAREFNLILNSVLCGDCETELDRDLKFVPEHLKARSKEILVKETTEHATL